MGSIRDIIDKGKKVNEEWASETAKKIIESEFFLDSIRQAVDVSLSSVTIPINVEDYGVRTDEEWALITQNMTSMLDAEGVSIDILGWELDSMNEDVRYSNVHLSW